MALVVKDRVQETSTTTGTGTITLTGAVSGFQSFSVIGNANTTYYAIVGGTEWEVGIGTYTALGTVLSRDTILESSNGGTAVNFSVGTKNVFVTYPAEKGLYLDASGNAIALGTVASATLTNATGLPLTTGVTGTLPIANGGTGTTSTTFTNLTTNVTGTLPVANGGTGITSLGTGVATFLGTPSSANLISAVTDETGSGALVFATSPTLVTPALGTPSSGTATNLTGLPLTTGVTGTLPVANGGTGQSTYTDGQLLIGNTTGNTLTKTTLTAGSGITVTNGSGAITIAASGGGGLGGMTVYSSGTPTFTIPSGKTVLKVTVTGGGGGGGGYQASSGHGGGAGGTAIKYLTGVTAGNTLAVTVGAGGNGGTANNNGTSGSTSSVASGTQTISTISATGGGGGQAANSAGRGGGVGGLGSGGDLNLTGQFGDGGQAVGGNSTSQGAGVGGASFWGGGGGANNGTNPTAGTNGAGGSGGRLGPSTGGAGGAGVVVFEY